MGLTIGATVVGIGEISPVEVGVISTGAPMGGTDLGYTKAKIGCKIANTNPTISNAHIYLSTLLAHTPAGKYPAQNMTAPTMSHTILQIMKIMCSASQSP